MGVADEVGHRDAIGAQVREAVFGVQPPASSVQRGAAIASPSS